MNQPTLNLKVAPITDPMSVLILNDRELLRQAQHLVMLAARKVKGAGLFSVTCLYRAATARARPLLNNRAMNQVRGVFGNGPEDVEYGRFAPESIEEAAAMGIWVGAERLKAILYQVAEDYQESIIGPAEYDPDEAGDVESVRNALLVALTLALHDVEHELRDHVRKVTSDPWNNCEITQVAGTMGVIVGTDQDDFEHMSNPALDASARDAGICANRSWTRELIEHLSDPEIAVARAAPALPNVGPIASSLRAANAALSPTIGEAESSTPSSDLGG